MATSNKHQSRPNARASQDPTNKNGKPKPSLQSIKDAAAELGDSAKHEVAEDWHSLKEGAADVKEKVGKTARNAAQRGEEIASEVGSTLEKTGRSVLQLVKNNPVPIALAGVSLGWLAVSVAASAIGRATAPSEASGVGNGDSTLNQAKERAHDVATRIQRKAGGVADETKELAHKAQQTARHTLEVATEHGKKIEQSFARMLKENPAAVGAAAVAVGAIIGAALPRTKIEDEWIGERRDEVVHKAQKLARGAVQKVGTTAQKVAGAARSTNTALHS